MSVPENMEDQPQVVLTESQKRPLEDDDDNVPVSTPKKAAPPPSDPSTPLTVLSSMASPSPLKTSQPTAPASSNNSVAGDAPASSNIQPPAKKRKLTLAEKEAQKLEKEAKAKAREEKKAQREAEDRIKAEKKAEKDEQKRMKDAEKAAKDEEKRRKAEEREEKKRAKEQEQAQKEEEQRKKERSQMRLVAFFKKPAGESPKTATVDAIITPAPATILLQPDVPMLDANVGPVSPQKAIQKAARCDYESYFLPFQIPSRAIMAPYNRYMEDPAKLAEASSRLDAALSQTDVDMDAGSVESLQARTSPTSRGGLNIPLAAIVERIHGSSDRPIDLTQEAGRDALELLKQIPMKYLHFPEDVRPPYYGTYTKPHTPREAARIARNPHSRTLHEANYDYDSEAEWEEPEEGEDLDSDGDEDLESEGDDDLDGFLDDEEDAQVKRRLIGGGDLQPVTTGLCWEDADGVSRLNDGSGAISTEFKEFRMGFLLTPQPHSIDPFSTAYWAPDPTPVAKHISPSGNGTLTSLMQPPRMPLTQRLANGMIVPPTSTPASGVAPKAAKAPGRMVSSDLLPAFKAAVSGSDMTKLALVESLKKQFPKLKKDEITNTLSAVAARVGPTQAEKRWVLV